MASNSNNSNEVDMTAPYADQMADVFSDVSTFVQGSGKTLTTRADLSGAWPEHSGEQTYTRGQVNAFVKRCITACLDLGKEMFDGLPTAKNVPKAGLVHSLRSTWTVKGGTHKGTVRYLLAHGAGMARKADKNAKKAAARNLALELAEAAGGLFYARGVTVSKDDDTLRPYPDAMSAMKAWARHPDNYGAEWWQGDKAAVLREAATHVGQVPADL